MRAPSLYLDTSVIGGYFDEEWKDATQELFRLADLELYFTAEAETLAQAYLAAGVVSPKYADDARHIAVATVHSLSLIVSWNFKHLANIKREAGFNAVNLLQGYPQIRILTPLQLLNQTDEDQDL